MVLFGYHANLSRYLCNTLQRHRNVKTAVYLHSVHHFQPRFLHIAPFNITSSTCAVVLPKT